MTACRNCGADLHGRYCHACGQKAVSTELRVHDLLHEGVHEFAHVDGKIVQTLRLLLFKPGELTAEFFRGRRSRYITPIRLYLVCSLLFFALSAWTASPFINIQLTKNDIENSAEREAVQKETIARLEHLRDEMTHNTPRAMFVLMPVFGLLSWACYRRAQPFYVPHVYCAVHVRREAGVWASVVGMLPARTTVLCAAPLLRHSLSRVRVPDAGGEGGILVCRPNRRCDRR